jgi:CubicO group peptidase (beta-lactamase class C family)
MFYAIRTNLLLGDKFMRKFVIIILFLVFAITPFFLDYNKYAKHEDVYGLIKNLETKTPNLLRKYNIPGASISIIEKGEIKWIGTFGYADIEEGTKINKDTVYQVASISKSATAVGIMKLVESGIINLDDPIAKYITRWQIPESIYDINEVTIRRVLSHTAGLSRGGGYPGYESFDKLPSLEESLSGTGGGSQPVKLIYKPGTRFSYSGGGYCLLQLLIEEVTGKDFAIYMGEEVLMPLKMEDSSFLWEEGKRGITARSYNEDLSVLPNYLFVERAAAGLYTTIEDMSRFVIAGITQYKDNHILKQEMIQEMYKPVLAVEGLEGFVYETTALGHFVNTNNRNLPIVAHDGSNRGWKSSISLVPDIGDGIVILTNGDNGTYLINEVLNSWHYKVIHDKRAFDKLSNKVNASIYAICAVLLLWSILALVGIYKTVGKGYTKIYILSSKVQFTKRCGISLVLVGFAYLIGIYVAPILGFIDPQIGNALLISISIRVFIGILQLFIPRRNTVTVTEEPPLRLENVE